MNVVKRSLLIFGSVLAVLALCAGTAAFVHARLAASPSRDSSAGSRGTGSPQGTGALIRGGASGSSYQQLAGKSARLLLTRFYNGAGEWHMCAGVRCNTKNSDWGADVLTYVLYLRWSLDHDPSVVPVLRRLAGSSPTWTPAKQGTADRIVWDSIASVREYQATGSRLALQKAEAAFARVADDKGYQTGACPAVDFQWDNGAQTGGLKTLETDSNYVKAALLLHQVTGKPGYLSKAVASYAAIRRYYLVPSAGLYTTSLLDNGATCTQIPGLYIASVNGNMIWAGAELARQTGDRTYLRQAIATAAAVRSHLSDASGVFADLQADSDIVEPLVEGMYALAVTDHVALARNWLLANAAAAAGGISADGAFGRFFDGPPPSGQVTTWEVNGGAALMQAAAALDPQGGPSGPGSWQGATFVPDSQTLAGPVLRLSFTGRAIAIMGTIGEHCCSSGHAAVSVDGVPTYSKVGIWQNRSSPARQLPGQVLFAWRWPTAGRHTIEITPGTYNQVQGGSFFHMTGYLLVR